MSLLDTLTPAERAAADAAVARLRAEDGAGGELELAIDRPGDDAPAPAPTAGERVEQLLAEQEAAQVEDFDRFWSAQARTGKVLNNVCGIDLTLPSSLPLRFEIESRRLMHDRTEGAVHKLFGMLFGEGTLATLIDRGLDGEQLSVLLMWGTVNGNGGDINLDEARRRFADMKARQAAGKPLVPSMSSGATSSGTGPSSRQTSRGSTKRKKKRSPR